jgi:putative ABC transport system permease protein
VSALDTLRYALQAVAGYRGRTYLILLAMGIGVAAVVALTTLADGARRYVAGEFAALGTHLLIVLPGRSETVGGPPPLLGATPRDLTIDDALALYRSRHVRRVAPVSVGAAPVSHGGREREVTVLGSTDALREVRHLALASGRFLPAADPRLGSPVCVLGATVKQELFGQERALGRWVRIGDWRFRVIGVLASEGTSLGMDLSEMVVIPVASAQALFDSPSLFRVLVEASGPERIEPAKEAIRTIVRERHEGEDDITIITQDAILATFDKVFVALTLTLGGVASISLVVAGVLIMNVMLVAVSQRTAEIGLLKAVGAQPRDILRVFLTEAAVLSLSGALVGLAVGLAGVWVVGRLYPVLPLQPPPWALAASLGTALVSGLVFGLLPARRAVRLDPVAALSRR